MDSPGAIGRRRGNTRSNAEDQALDQIAREVSRDIVRCGLYANAKASLYIYYAPHCAGIYMVSYYVPQMECL